MPWIEQLTLAIDARAHEALSIIAQIAGSPARCEEHASAALCVVRDLANRSPVFPGMFKSSEFLREAWKNYRFWLEERQWEPEQGTQEAAHKAAITARIENDDWTGLGLPSPHEALSTLLEGQVLEVRGHSVQYDRAGEITWYTNPYGVDGALCNVPDVAVVRRFLSNMARDKDYGAVPC
jgi:hypothetical protein